jgi:hypothetical protein
MVRADLLRRNQKMAIIKKRADELKPGDVLTLPSGGPRWTVIAVELGPQMGALARVATVRLGEMPPQTRVDEHYKTELLHIEVPEPDLTPAQQHAEELLALVRQAETWLSDVPEMAGVREWLAAARRLRATIAPEPPTLAEALAQLQAVHDAKHPGDELVRVQLLLDRARRAGVL